MKVEINKSNGTSDMWLSPTQDFIRCVLPFWISRRVFPIPDDLYMGRLPTGRIEFYVYKEGDTRTKEEFARQNGEGWSDPNTWWICKEGPKDQ